MPNGHHDEAQRMATEAAIAFQAGRRKDAIALFEEAAQLERLALAEVPSEKVRTRGILAVSYAALLYKAALLDRAEQAIYEMLAAVDIHETSRRELRELLEAVWDEQALATDKLRYSGDQILIALRGGQIGAGTAPLETALHYMGGMTSLVYRVTEWQGQFPFRTRGLPPSEVQQFAQARATQPSAGSFRFSIKLVEPIQQWLLPEIGRVDPRKVSEAIIRILQSAALDSAEPLSTFVTDARYRTALTKLVRNVLPNTADLREVEIRTLSDSTPEQMVTLGSAARGRIAEQLRSDLASEPAASPVRIEGILRALHLDRRWLEVAIPGGSHVRFSTRPDEVDDVIGPMVNRHVVAFGTVGREGKNPLLMDIQLKESDQEP